MIELSEFLLARIAEDEQAIRDNWNARTGITDERWWGTPFQPSRVLAECEAKRRIVAAFEELRDHAWTATATHPMTPALDRGSVEIIDRMMLPLVLPYVDHPDCHEEWKP